MSTIAIILIARIFSNQQVNSKNAQFRILHVFILCALLQIISLPIIVDGAYNTLHTSSDILNATKSGGKFQSLSF